MNDSFNESNEFDYQSIIDRLHGELREAETDLARYKRMYDESIAERIPKEEYWGDCSMFWRGGMLSAVIAAFLTLFFITPNRAFNPFLLLFGLLMSGAAIFIGACLRMFFINPKMGKLRNFWIILPIVPLIYIFATMIRGL